MSAVCTILLIVPTQEIVQESLVRSRYMTSRRPCAFIRDCAKNQYLSFLTPLAPLIRGELSDKSP